MNILNVDKDIEELELSYTVGRTQNDGIAAEKSLAVACQMKHILTTWPRNSTPTYLPGEMKIYIHTKTCT